MREPCMVWRWVVVLVLSLGWVCYASDEWPQELCLSVGGVVPYSGHYDYGECDVWVGSVDGRYTLERKEDPWNYGWDISEVWECNAVSPYYKASDRGCIWRGDKLIDYGLRKVVMVFIDCDNRVGIKISHKTYCGYEYISFFAFFDVFPNDGNSILTYDGCACYSLNAGYGGYFFLSWTQPFELPTRVTLLQYAEFAQVWRYLQLSDLKEFTNEYMRGE
jgi:hypothetical protein